MTHNSYLLICQDEEDKIYGVNMVYTYSDSPLICYRQKLDLFQFSISKCCHSYTEEPADTAFSNGKNGYSSCTRRKCETLKGCSIDSSDKTSQSYVIWSWLM